MAKQSQNEIDQLIQRARPTNRDVARRDVNQGINSPVANLIVKVSEYYYNDGTSKELLNLNGTITCYYKGSRYNIPIEIWLQQDYPNTQPLVYVKPTQDMHVSQNSRDVLPDGTVTIPYIKKWRHPNSDMQNLLAAMSDAFGQSPPVYSNVGASNHSTNVSMSTGNSASSSTSASYPHGYPQTTLPRDVIRDSIQSAVMDKLRGRLKETIQLGNAQIDSLRRTEQDLTTGESQLQSLLSEAKKQQAQAQTYLTNMRAKTAEMSEAIQKMSSSSSPGNEHSVRDDALTTPAPVYKQLLQAYAEEHAIQDLLYYLGEGLRRESIGLDTYLKHVRELSRKQFMLRATMQRCRQIAGLPVK